MIVVMTAWQFSSPTLAVNMQVATSITLILHMSIPKPNLDNAMPKPC